MSTARERDSADETSSPLDDNERSLWFAWKHAHEVVRTRVAEGVTAATGLSDPDVAILIRVADAGGSLRQNQLAARMGWDRTRLSHQISRMEIRGLVVRRKLDNGMEISLSRTGQDMVDLAQPIHAAAVRQHLIDPFTPAQIAQLREALRRISTDDSPS